MDTSPFARSSLAAALALALALSAGCGHVETTRSEEATATGQNVAVPAMQGRSDPKPAAATDKPEEGRPETTTMYKGSGVLLKPPQPAKEPTGGSTSLNFEAADVRDIAKTVLAEILRENYIVDPKVGGTISFRTSSPLPREALLPTLETVLRMNGIVMIRENGIFKIMPAAGAKGSLSPKMAGAAMPGFTLQVVPLKYVGAKEMARILESVAADPAAVKTDEVRNLLILAGTQNELQHMLDTVEMFDVDWLAGMSVGLFVLQSADVKSVDAEINKILGEKAGNPLAGALRIIPLERLNGFIIITPQPHYLEQAKLWLERLDRAGGASGSRLYVYRVQNGKAEHLADLLNQMFAPKGQAGQPRPTAPTLAPGLSPTELRSSGAPGSTGFGAMGSGTAGFGTTGFGTTGSGTTGLGGTGFGTTAARPAMPAIGATLAIGDESGSATSEVRVVADRENNALLILANAAGYDKLEAALKKLDVAPRQVLIEVMIAEVTLTNELSYGVEWWYSHGPRKTGTLDMGKDPGINQLVPGFSYALANASGAAGLKAVLNMLATDNKVNVLSSPHVMVADNQTAKIQVGDSVPIQGQQTIATGGAAVVSSVQYLDTGIILSVTPRINAGGLVNLDISQEFSIPGAENKALANSPTISKRAAKTQVTVQSGETMVLGGLISEKTDNGTAGIPFLSSIPVVGGLLFGSTNRSTTKTELIVLITPRVAHNTSQAKAISEELQRRMGETRNLLDCGTSNLFGMTTRGGLWCLQPRRFDGPIDKMMIEDDKGVPLYLKEEAQRAGRR